MNYTIKIFPTFIFILFGNYLIAQAQVIQASCKNILKIEKIDFHFGNHILLDNDEPVFSILFKNKRLPISPSFSQIKFDCNDLATFCRLELQIEKVAKFPIKFRIGEVQYVEQMEGKY